MRHSPWTHWNSPVFPTEAFYGFLSPWVARKCALLTYQRLSLCSAAPITLGQVKAAMEVKNQNAPLSQDHSEMLQSVSETRGSVGLLELMAIGQPSIMWNHVSSLPVIHCPLEDVGKVRSPCMDLWKQEFSMHCEVQHSFPGWSWSWQHRAKGRHLPIQIWGPDSGHHIVPTS